MNIISNLPRSSIFFLSAIVFMGVCSCDKVKDAGASLKAWWGEGDEASDGSDSSAEVVSVNREEGEQIIAEESRLVMVEYYSDT